MGRMLVQSLVVIAAVLASGPVGLAAPRPADKESAETEKAIKAAVAKFVAAMSEQNVDAFVEACGVPFSVKPGALARDAPALRKLYKVEVEGRPPFDAHEVKRIETLKDAKARLGEGGVKSFDEVLGDRDYVVAVELRRRGRTYQSRLLIKPVDGQPKVVGWRPGGDE